MRNHDIHSSMKYAERGDFVVINNSYRDPSGTNLIEIMAIENMPSMSFSHNEITRRMVTGRFRMNQRYTIRDLGGGGPSDVYVEVQGMRGQFPAKYFVLAGKAGAYPRERESDIDRYDRIRRERIEDEQARMRARHHQNSLSDMMARQEEAVLRAARLPSEAVIDGKKIKLDSKDDQSDILVIKQLVKLDL